MIIVYRLKHLNTSVPFSCLLVSLAAIFCPRLLVFRLNSSSSPHATMTCLFRSSGLPGSHPDSPEYSFYADAYTYCSPCVTRMYSRVVGPFSLIGDALYTSFSGLDVNSPDIARYLFILVYDADTASSLGELNSLAGIDIIPILLTAPVCDDHLPCSDPFLLEDLPITDMPLLCDTACQTAIPLIDSQVTQAPFHSVMVSDCTTSNSPSLHSHCCSSD